MSAAGSLRERQAAVIRDAILDAVARRLDSEDPEDIAMPQIAADAGISLRTLYRYFPTREAVFEAVGDHVVARLGLPHQIQGADDIARVFRESAARGAQSPELVRAMLWTRLGRRARSSHRRRRVESMMTALAEVTSHLPAQEARRRAGAVVYLASLPAWITVSEECGLSAEDAQRGIAWAIETLVATLRGENDAQQGAHRP
ncbi:MAG TPA: helix-turn-helix domain-containing protein [Streptosporangiaceae bacterium]|nr:helix-turn-helix domain-containing protein [Streptosporangiaceae bacterium]